MLGVVEQIPSRVLARDNHPVAALSLNNDRRVLITFAQLFRYLAMTSSVSVRKDGVTTQSGERRELEPRTLGSETGLLYLRLCA